MNLKDIFMALLGVSFGLLASAGVFTVLVSVGLIPRFAGKTHTSKHVFLYEEMVVAGTLAGGLISVFEPFMQFGNWVLTKTSINPGIFLETADVFLGAYGVFAGMFVGCLALAIAEMLDSIPILARRIGLRHGIGCAVLAIALGKLCGSLLYFFMHIQ